MCLFLSDQAPEGSEKITATCSKLNFQWKGSSPEWQEMPCLCNPPAQPLWYPAVTSGDNSLVRDKQTHCRLHGSSTAAARIQALWLFSWGEILLQPNLEVLQYTRHCTLQKFSFGVMSHILLLLKSEFLSIWRKASGCAGLAASSEAPVLVLNSSLSLLSQMRQGRKWVYNDVFCRRGETGASHNHKKSCLLWWFQRLSTHKGRYGKSKVSVGINGTHKEQMIPFPQESNPLWSPAGLAKWLWLWPPPVSPSDVAGLY